MYGIGTIELRRKIHLNLIQFSCYEIKYTRRMYVSSGAITESLIKKNKQIPQNFA